MKPTHWVPLLIAALIGLGAGWVAVQIVDRAAGRVLMVPGLAAVGLWLLALAVLVWALVSRGALTDARRQGRTPATIDGRPDPGRRRMPALVAARTAALAMAASRTGALIGGFYVGIALALIPVASTASGSTSLGVSVASILACLVLVAAAVWLERMCRIREDDRP